MTNIIEKIKGDLLEGKTLMAVIAPEKPKGFINKTSPYKRLTKQSYLRKLWLEKNQYGLNDYDVICKLPGFKKYVLLKEFEILRVI